MHRAFKPELKSAASPLLLERGCVSVIGLEEIKIEAGPRWEKMCRSIWARLETLLRQKLGPTDFFAPLDDTSFLITMPTATHDESQIFCLRIAHELHTSLLGHCDIGLLRVARATRLEGDILELNAITGDALIGLAAKAGLQLPPGVAVLGLPVPKIIKATGLNRDTGLQFSPLWDVQKEAITTYRCETINDQPTLSTAPETIKFRTALAGTLSRIQNATQLLADDLKIGQRFIMCIPIPFDLISSPVARMEITSICRGLSSALRPYLMFEISELPYGVPQSRLSELVGSLRPFCRGVSALLPARILNYGAYQGAGFHAIGISLAPHVVGATELFSEVVKLCGAAKGLHLKSFVLEVPSLDALRMALVHGTNAVTGLTIGRPLALPAPIRRLSPHDIPGLMSDYAAAASKKDDLFSAEGT